VALKLRAKPLATAAARLRVTPAHNDNDALLGGRGNDVLGGNNNDTLDGGSGNDALTGVVRIKGDDRIMALLLAESENRLEVGVGQYCVIELDVIALLEGIDTFVFAADFGRDVIIVLQLVVLSSLQSGDFLFV